MSLSVEARVTGRVQGVAYRNWTRSRARALGLTGWVRNDVSGAVIAHLEGDKKTVHQMVEELWSGPGAASVRDVQHRAISQDHTSTHFEIID
ncbi:acylphosphatase [Cognatishimia activa]|uniref:acylphosphatase n=1 Tax=Cognatishimia activa TaxID=1715691 RepID=A0A0P1IRP5_9RHOB|nr:acylphosphatase [Cognatishimia activa]CUJ02700.1 Acylphosphatase [Cognatishimia activa]CUK26133.1 Acylphosphatase [Cognatishimia activa]